MIVRGGFRGVSAAQNLKSNLVDVTLIDRRNYHLFQSLKRKAVPTAAEARSGTSTSGTKTGAWMR